MKKRETPLRSCCCLFKKWRKLNLLMFLFIGMASSSIFAQTASQKAKIIQATNIDKLNELQQQYAGKLSRQKERALAAAEENGWEITLELDDGGFAELHRVTNDGTPIYYRTFNVEAAVSTRTNHLQENGSLGLSLNGENMMVHVWDSGYPRLAHQEFVNADGSSRIILGDRDPLLPINARSHSSHVSGTIVASGVDPDAKGMASEAMVTAYNWDNDLVEAVEAAANGMMISNHSYGLVGFRLGDLFFGGYIEETRDWDELLYSAPYYLMVHAAGNDGLQYYNETPLEGNRDFDKLTQFNTAKNSLSVTNVTNTIVDGNGNLLDVDINVYSSVGPTDDYRIKPDIAGNGTNIYSTYHLRDNDYAIITGTSMASPNVAGSLLLLQDHYQNLNGMVMKAATIKGLALHTADDAGISGPDAIFGWGVMNAKAAATTISNNGKGTLIEERTLVNGETHSFTVSSDEVNALMVSISWTDPAGTVQTQINDNTPRLVNDLDVTITKNAETYRPYKLTGVSTNDTGDNNVDPFERVDVLGATGTYTVTITHKGSLSNGSQDYSLIVTGLAHTPELCNATVPTDLEVHDVKDRTASVSWNAPSPATYELRYRVAGSGNWITKTADGYAFPISELLPNTSYEVQVRSRCPNGATSSYSGSTTFTTTDMIYCKCIGVPDRTIIGNVNVGDINNTSDNFNGYVDFTDISTDLNRDEQYTIVVTKDKYEIYDFGFAVYIDYNQNGSFSDEGELAWGVPGSFLINPVRGNFTVPNTAVSGSTRMRVITAYGGIASPCLNNFAGDVEDYTVNIQGGDGDVEAPTAPTNLVVTGVSNQGVGLFWDASTDNVGVTGYQLVVNGVPGRKVPSTFAAVSGLQPGTTYQFNVLAFDAAGNNSEMSNTLEVTTTGGNGVVTIRKANASNFSIASSDGGVPTQNVYLSAYDPSDVNQQWEEIDRGNGYYSYKKVNTDYCMDGDHGGNNTQNVYLWECIASEQNQHWKKVDVGNGAFRLEKRNAPAFSIDGDNGGNEGQNVYLWSSDSGNGNQQWIFTQVGADISPEEANAITGSDEAGLKIYPIPVEDVMEIAFDDYADFLQLQVVDLTGETVISETVISGNDIALDTSELPSGVYMLRAIQPDGSAHVIRFVK